MNRRSFLGFIAALPVFGSLLAAPKRSKASRGFVTYDQPILRRYQGKALGSVRIIKIEYVGKSA